MFRNIFIIFILWYIAINIYIYNTEKQALENNIEIYQKKKIIYKKESKEIQEKIENIIDKTKKIEKFKNEKQDVNSVFYLKLFLEWILPNNNKAKSITLKKWKNENIIEYKDTNLWNILKLLEKIKYLKKNWYIDSYDFKTIIQWKSNLYVIKIKIISKNLQKYLNNFKDKDFYLIYYNSIINE